MGGKEIYNVASSYDPETNMWEQIACRMNDCRVGLGKERIGEREREERI